MEIWKDIKGYEGSYKVSSLGNVKSLARKGCLKDRILKTVKNSDGYYIVVLSDSGKFLNKKIHQLVSIAFLNHNPCGMSIQVDHINGIKTDNRVENLQLLNSREHNAKTAKQTRNKSSKYTGVNWYERDNKWQSNITIKNKLIYLGIFTNELEASKMYKLALTHINKYKGNNKGFREYLLSLCYKSVAY